MVENVSNARPKLYPDPLINKHLNLTVTICTWIMTVTVTTMIASGVIPTCASGLFTETRHSVTAIAATGTDSSAFSGRAFACPIRANTTEETH